MKSLEESLEEEFAPQPVAWRFSTSLGAKWQYGDAPVPQSVYKHEPLYTHKQLLEYGMDTYDRGYRDAYG